MENDITVFFLEAPQLTPRYAKKKNSNITKAKTKCRYDWVCKGNAFVPRLPRWLSLYRGRCRYSCSSSCLMPMEMPSRKILYGKKRVYLWFRRDSSREHLNRNSCNAKEKCLCMMGIRHRSSYLDDEGAYQAARWK